MQILHVQNPQAFSNPMFLDLFKRALTALPGAAPAGVDGCADEIFACVANKQFVTVVGVEDGEFRCLMVTLLPDNNIYPYPNVFAFYNEGSKALSSAVKTRMMDICLEKGYTTYRTANMTGRSEDVYQRAMKFPGATFTPIGMVYEIKAE